MNVLLLNMSILNYNTYSFTVDPTIAATLETDWNELITYHGQMEPVPRFLIKALYQKGKKLDQIVVMNTQETIELKEAKINGNTCMVIAYDFFIDQIKKSCDELQIEYPHFESFVFAESAGEEANSKTDELSHSYLNTVSRAVNYLRNLKETSDDFSLYLDIHGGPRPMAYLSIAVVNLLNVEGIIPKMNLTVNERKGGTPRIDYIIEKDNLSTDMLDFTAAMRTFLQYGRAEGLRQYGEKYKENEDNTRFLKIVYDISDAIITCDVNAFEESLLDLRKELARNINYKSELDIFKKNIRTSYGKLLTDEMTTFDQVDWCVQKGFIQQALTLIEAHMGEYLYNQFFDDKSVYYLKKNNKVRMLGRSEWPIDGKQGESKRVLHHIREDRPWESLSQRLFSKWADTNKLVTYLSEDSNTSCYLGTNWNGEMLTKHKSQIHRIFSKLEKYKDNGFQFPSNRGDDEKTDARFVEQLVRYPDLDHLNQEEPEKCHLPMYQGYFEKDKDNNRKTVKEIYLPSDAVLDDAEVEKMVEKEGVLVKFQLKPGLDFEQKVTLHKVLYMHFILVKYRNEIMHAVLGKHVPTDTLRKDMKQYVEWIKTLI